MWQSVPSIAHFFQHDPAIFPVPVLNDMRFWAYNCHLRLTNFWKKKLVYQLCLQKSVLRHGGKYYKNTENMSLSIQPIRLVDQNSSVLRTLLNTRLLQKERIKKIKALQINRTCCHPKSSKLLSQCSQDPGSSDFLKKCTGQIFTSFQCLP